jgi:hypothetical protein
MSPFDFNKPKLKELIVYIASKTANDKSFGKTKMEKAIWRSDFETFKHLGSPVVGAPYKRFEMGAIPLRFMGVLKEMIDAGEVKYADDNFYRAKKIVALRVPNEELFTVKEREIVDGILQEFGKMSSAEIVNWGHKFNGVKFTPRDAFIPLASALFEGDTRNLSEKDMEYGKRILEKL